MQRNGKTDKHTIPSEAVRYQKEYDCNHSEHVAAAEDEKVYSLLAVDDNGFPIPTVTAVRSR